MQRVGLLAAWSVGMVGAGVYWERHYSRQGRTSDFPVSTCCSADAHEPLLNELRQVVGSQHVLVDSQTTIWTKGARIGQGHAVAVVQPGSLSEALNVVKSCVAKGIAVLPQGANTGLTGGSVPRDEAERDFVVVNMRRLTKMLPLDEGRRVLAFSGAGIYDLSQTCAKLGRESHSVLGSVFLNPSVGGGVALGSGGTQIRKGPAFTERLLYVRVDENQQVQLVNTLGLQLDDKSNNNDEALLELLQEATEPLALDPTCTLESHDADYKRRVCELDGHVSRWNADTRGCEAVRSEGKVLILASIHSTFPQPRRSVTYWIACVDIARAQQLRRLCLESPDDLPSSLEYMNGASFDIIDRAGRGLCAVIRLFGIGSALLRMWQLKTSIEAIPLPWFDRLPDKLIYWTNPLLPRTLSSQLNNYGQRFDHHLLLTIEDFGDGAYDRLIAKVDEFTRSAPAGSVEAHICSAEEAAAVKFFRFAAAPAFKTFCVGRGLTPLSVDYALPKNYEDVPELQGVTGIEQRMRYSHFGCAVVHEDIAFRDEEDVDRKKLTIKNAIEKLGGALPAEHGHGMEYHAPPETLARWQATDPTNSFNPGVGQSTSRPRWQESD